MNKFIYWTPRVLSILLIVFLAIFSLDVFEENLGFWKTILGLLIHNIPSIILAVIIWISWKYEIVRGVTFIIAGIAHMIFSLVRAHVEPWYIYFLGLLIIDIPAFLIGILFLIGWHKKKNNASRLKSKIFLRKVALNFCPLGNITADKRLRNFTGFSVQICFANLYYIIRSRYMKFSQ